MKNKYQTPQIIVLISQEDDVITASVPGGGLNVEKEYPTGGSDAGSTTGNSEQWGNLLG